MTLLRKISCLAQYWKAYQNVLQMLKIRGYKYNSNDYNLPFHEFSNKLKPVLINCQKDNHSQYILYPLTISVLKDDDNSVIDPLFKPLHLQPIDEVITCFLDASMSMNNNNNKEDDEKKQPQVSIIEPDSITNHRPILHLSYHSNNSKDTTLINMDIEQCLTNEVIVLFGYHISGAFGIDAIKQIIHYQKIINNYHLILILHNEHIPGNVISSHPETQSIIHSMKLPSQENDGRRVECFSLISVMFDLTCSFFHSPIEKLDKKVADKWLEDHHLKKEQLETILMDDPMTSYYDLKVGDLIAVHSIDNCTNIMAVGTKK